MDSGQPVFTERFLKAVGKSLREDVPLLEYSHFRIGGPADYFFAPSSLSDLVQAVRFARQQKIPHFIIGGGYNLLFDDHGFRGLIIKNCIHGIEKKNSVEVDVLSGTSLQGLVEFCVAHEMEGLEFLAGIPGTVGGAVFGNAGAFEQDVGSYIAQAVILDRKGEQVPVDRRFFAFGYRQSRLKSSQDILLKATFMLKKGVRQNMERKIAENLAKREKKHPPWDVACAGSYFKNPVLPDGKRVPAAHFLERVGAKGLVVGGAAVFAEHANFIINKKDATAKDILGLARELKKRVKKKFGIELEEEVIYLQAELPAP